MGLIQSLYIAHVSANGKGLDISGLTVEFFSGCIFKVGNIRTID